MKYVYICEVCIHVCLGYVMCVSLTLMSVHSICVPVLCVCVFLYV